MDVMLKEDIGTGTLQQKKYNILHNIPEFYKRKWVETDLTVKILTNVHRAKGQNLNYFQ